MRLRPLSEHIEFLRRERRFGENVLLALAVRVSAAEAPRSEAEHRQSTETLQNKTLLDLIATKCIYL